MTTQAWPSCVWWHASPQAVTARWVRTANMTQGQCEARHTLEQERSYYTPTHTRCKHEQPCVIHNCPIHKYRFINSPIHKHFTDILYIFFFCGLERERETLPFHSSRWSHSESFMPLLPFISTVLYTNTSPCDSAARCRTLTPGNGSKNIKCTQTLSLICHEPCSQIPAELWNTHRRHRTQTRETRHTPVPPFVWGLRSRVIQPAILMYCDSLTMHKIRLRRPAQL